jgi:hypothetical protein
MATRSTKARARVQLTVEFDVGSTWGADCTTDQVFKQARDEAIDDVRAGLVIDGLTINLPGAVGGGKTSARIVGEPKVTMVLLEEER